MAYFQPYIDTTGIHAPTYQDIMAQCIEKMQQIFGKDIYIAEDSQDYEQIAIFAKMVYDVTNLALLVYNDRTPTTAVGTGLDNVVAYAGITRKPATYSTVTLVITGDESTVINNGVAIDTNGNKWSLPETVTIPSNGTISVSAKSSTEGNFSALPNTITKIGTPVYGWTSVTNPAASAPGTDVETDFSLRGRYSLSTVSPAASIFESLLESLKNIPNVTRVVGYDNDTGSTSNGTEPPGLPAGIPPHSVSFAVEGGDDVSVATELYLKKGPGCGTFGSTTVDLTSISGNTIRINFYRPEYTNLKLRITLVKLLGYSDEYGTEIKQAMYDYIQGLSLGETLYNVMLTATATDALANRSTPSYVIQSVEVSKDGGTTYVTETVKQNYWGAFQTTLDDIEIVEVAQSG